MSGKKGLYVYQQIVKTTAEWALDDTVYPAHVFLLEELSNGKFNIAISDGEHAYSDLNPQFVDCNVSVLENTASSYKLRFVTPSGNYDTPNLKVDVSEVTNNSSQYVLQIRIGDTVITTPNLKGENAGAVPATAERRHHGYGCQRTSAVYYMVRFGYLPGYRRGHELFDYCRQRHQLRCA